ncbi:GCN5-related N-acetyltransferase [Ancylobacter novellus DSM 506]|uniref:GCN5-related N-acetyltransferase n=1 Tax=Ancylobacter novellus (strain ATCC 8093 / DSM 506 / JCM 20403 / CCM 1077 / IAM 12100 / NBRC 12443 / NCIMB 10456) TaxID=639283 RepID=D6ZZL5_ANCN5|nr:N-acetyltransferase [Ancylobacter novellus]ADH91210.1 GCN5-related N-acetyltransferase [Ancylobacter novellus DSM 506]
MLATAAPVISLETDADIAQREALLDLSFGRAARLAKTSERLREGRKPAEGLAFAAHGPDGRVIATLRLWHVAAGPGRPALLLGPLAVHPWFRDRGLGGAMMSTAINEAALRGHGAIMLVGDAPYYARFGFDVALTEGLWLPGSFDRNRFLGLELVPGALEGARGLVSPTGEMEALPSLDELVTRAAPEMKRSA